MITLEDCVAMSGLTEEEVLAIAEHQHVPEIVACGLAQYLTEGLHRPDVVRDMIVADIRSAMATGRTEHVRELLQVLHHFLHRFPDVRPPDHPWSQVL